MTPSEVKEHFRTGYNFRKITKMSDNTLHNWTKAGYIPYVSQKKIELVTDGLLTAEWDPKELEVRGRD